MRKRPTFLRTTFSVLLLFSVISYGEAFDQRQEPKQTGQPAGSTGNSQDTTQESAKLKVTANQSAAVMLAAVSDEGKASQNAAVTSPFPAQLYTATAYSLRGRTASGRTVSRGLIAADPAVLPLGTRVRVEAGSLSGEYLVADTGGAVRGRRIDIWTPTAREAMQFGRRAVKLTILSLGTRRHKSDERRLRKEVTAAPNPAK